MNSRKDECTLTLLQNKTFYTKNYGYGPPHKQMIAATFRDEDGALYEYAYDPKAKTGFAATLTQMKSGDTLTVKATFEEHYHRGKNGEENYYWKMIRPTRVYTKEEKEQIENEEHELMF